MTSSRRALSLRVNFTWTFIGNVIFAAAKWGMVAVLARMGTPEIVGQFALGLAITAPIITFANLALRAVQATDANRRYSFSVYLGLRLVTTILALAVIGGFVVVVGYGSETALVILSIGLAKGIEAISDIYWGVFQQRERMDRIAWSMIIKGPLSLLALTIGFAITGGVLGAIAGMTLIWILVLIIYEVPTGMSLLRGDRGDCQSIAKDVKGSEHRPTWDLQVLGDLAKLALPLGVTTMLVSLNSSLPRLFIERYWGEYELGLFAAMAYLVVVGGTVVSALGQSASPRLAKYYAERNSRAFATLLSRLVGIGAILGVAGIVVTSVAGREILTLLYGSEYAMHIDVLTWIMVAATVTYVSSLLGYGMTASGQFSIQPKILVLTATMSTILGYVLIPEYGMLGATWTIFGSLGLQAFLSLLTNLQAIRKIGAWEGKAPAIPRDG